MLIEQRKAHPELTDGDLGKLFNITRQRVNQLLKKLVS